MAGKGLSLKVLMQLQMKEFQQGLKAVQKQLNTFKNYMKSAFALGSVTMFGKQMIEVGKSFEDAMAKVKAVSNATADEFKAMQKEAQKMGESTRYTATEAANALENLTRNGMSATQATKSLSSVLQLAQANAIGLSEAADIMTNIMNAYGLSVADATRINDVMSSTAGNAATNISELYEAMAEAGPYAKIMGKSIEEVAAAAGVMANNGIKGSVAGKAIAAMFQRLSSITPKAQKVLDQYGVSISEAELKTKDLQSILKKLADSGMGNSVGALSELFGKNYAGNIATLINGLSDFNNMLQITQNSAGTTARMFGQSVGSVQKEIDTLKSKYEGLLVSMSQKTSGVVKSVVKLLQNLIDNFKTVGGSIMNIASVAVPLLTTKVLSLAKSMKSFFTMVKTEGAAATAMMGGWITMIASLVTWIGTALVGAWNKAHQAMREANKQVAESEANSKKLQYQVGLLINKLGDSSDKNSLAGVVAEATRLFPEFADAIKSAGEVAAQTGNWEHLKGVLQDIVDLENLISSKEGKSAVAEAQGRKVGKMLWENSGLRRGTVGWSQSDNNAVRNVNNRVISSMKNNGFEKDDIKEFFNELGRILIKSQSADDTKSELARQFSDYSIEVSTEELDKWYKAVSNDWIAGGGLFDFSGIVKPSGQISSGQQTNKEIGQIDSTGFANIINSFNDTLKQQTDSLNTQGKEYKKVFDAVMRGAAEEAQSKVKAYAEKSNIAIPQEISKQIAENMMKYAPQAKTTTTTINNGGGSGNGSGSKVKTDADRLKDIFDDYQESLVKLENQHKAGAITDEEYIDSIDDLIASTYRSITAFSDLDNLLMQLGGDTSQMMVDIVEGFQNAKQIAETEKKSAANKANYEKFSKYTAPTKGTRDTKWDFSKTGVDILGEQAELSQKYVDDLKQALDDLMAGQYGDGGEVTEAIQKLKEELQKAGLEAETLKEKADFAEMTKYVEEMQLQLSQKFVGSLNDIHTSIGSIVSSWQSFSEMLDDDDATVFEKIYNYVGLIINAMQTTLTLIEAVKTAEEAWTAIKKLQTAQVVKGAMTEMGAIESKTAAESGEAVASATASGAKLPFPLNLVAIAAGIAAVMGALKLVGAFADGGIVGGNSTTGDKQLARVNSGEMILNKHDQGTLFNAIKSGNFGGGNVNFRIEGKDLVGTLNNYSSQRRG